MKVRMHSERTFEIILTDNESQNVKRIADHANVKPAKLLEQLIDSSVQAASDQLRESQLPPWDE